MPQVAFVLNPVRVPDPDAVSRACREAALRQGWRPLVLETTPAAPGHRQARAAIRGGARLVVAIGGDGTVRACAEALAGTAIPLGIVPRGTGNLAARALRLPSHLGEALDVALDGRERVVDVACSGERVFLGMAGMGLDAEVVAATPPGVKRRVGWAAYAAVGMAHLRGHGALFRVRLDGGRVLEREARAVVVGNVGLLPGGWLLLPRARLDDGVLDVGILAPATPLDWMRVGGRVILRGGHADRRLERHRARRVEIAADRDLPREMDGELLPPGRSLEVSVRPDALLVRVPDPRVRGRRGP